MNIKALTLSIISVAAAVAASTPAQAQEAEAPRPNARWSFAPNVWKKETIQMPRGYNAPAPIANVRSGSVPKASSLLGDPTYLAKAPAPMPAPLVRVNQAVSAVPIAVRPASPLEAFQKAFGKPVSAAPVMVAAAPQGMSATPASTLPSTRSVAARRIPSHRPSVSTNTAIKMLPKRSAPAAIANYGSLGFTPGAYTPTAGSSGSGATTSVRATLWNKH